MCSDTTQRALEHTTPGGHHGAVVGVLQLTIIPYLTYEGGRRALIEGVRVAAGSRVRRGGDEEAPVVTLKSSSPTENRPVFVPVPPQECQPWPWNWFSSSRTTMNTPP